MKSDYGVKQMENSIITKINNLEIQKKSFINGKFVSSISGNIISKVSSADLRDLSGLSDSDENDVNNAVQIAKKRFEQKVWVDKDPSEKKEILLKLACLMEENREELALLDTLETGRSFKNYFYDSIPKAIESLRYFAESIDKIYDYSIPPRKKSFSVVTREPMGVVGLITPWNDPLVVSVWKFAPALLMGNSVVIKPAEESSFSILKVAELSKEAGIPDGIFNVITGSGEKAGKYLSLHNDVRGIFFTGSSATGKLILQYSGQSNMKKIGLECGGKSPFIITENCKNIEESVKTLAKNIFYNQGQICSAPSRLIVNKNLKSKVLEILFNEMEKYSPDNPFFIDTEVGCIVNKTQKDKVENYIKDGMNSSSDFYQAKPSLWFSSGDRIAVLPTVFYNIKNSPLILKEEVFGPVLTVIDFAKNEEALEIANNTNYGLAASVWTDNMNEAYFFARELQAGIVHINSYGDDDNSVPFGGFKESGIGKDKSLFAFDDYSNLKTTWIKFNNIIC